jgi:hypothetical protein
VFSFSFDSRNLKKFPTAFFSDSLIIQKCIIQAGHGGSHLQSQLLGSRGRRITVQDQSRQQVSKTLSQRTNHTLSVHADNSSYTGGISRRIIVWGWPRQRVEDPIWKITKA